MERALSTPNAIPHLRALVLNGATTTTGQCLLPQKRDWISLLFGRVPPASKRTLAGGTTQLRDISRPGSPISDLSATAADEAGGTGALRTLITDADPFWTAAMRHLPLRVAVSVRESWLSDLVDSTADMHYIGASDRAVAMAAVDFLDLQKPGLLYVTLGDYQTSLAAFGEGSLESVAALEAVDEEVGAIMDALVRRIEQVLCGGVGRGVCMRKCGKSGMGGWGLFGERYGQLIRIVL